MRGIGARSVGGRTGLLYGTLASCVRLSCIPLIPALRLDPSLRCLWGTWAKLPRAQGGSSPSGASTPRWGPNAYTVYYIPYAVYCIPYAVCRISYTIYLYCMPYTIHHTPYTIHHTPYTLHLTPPARWTRAAAPRCRPSSGSHWRPQGQGMGQGMRFRGTSRGGPRERWPAPAPGQPQGQPQPQGSSCSVQGLHSLYSQEPLPPPPRWSIAYHAFRSSWMCSTSLCSPCTSPRRPYTSQSPT